MYAHLYFLKNTVFLKKKPKWLYVKLNRRDLNSCYREAYATQVYPAGDAFVHLDFLILKST